MQYILYILSPYSISFIALGCNVSLHSWYMDLTWLIIQLESCIVLCVSESLSHQLWEVLLYLSKNINDTLWELRWQISLNRMIWMLCGQDKCTRKYIICCNALVGTSRYLQYIPRNKHTVFDLLCFVVVIHWLIFPYPSGFLHWHCGNLTIAPVPAKQPWWIWINTSCEIIMNDCITTTKQSTAKPCAYFLGYTVCMDTYLHFSEYQNLS